MGNICVKLCVIIVSYVYKKPNIIIKHRSRHKFQMSKEDGFTNLKFDFIKSISPKRVIFERSCKLHHISYLAITNCLWPLLITFFKCSPIVWRPHQCAHDMFDNSSCLCIWVIHIMDQFPK
jgi:type II secretory pathway component PulC